MVTNGGQLLGCRLQIVDQPEAGEFLGDSPAPEEKYPRVILFLFHFGSRSIECSRRSPSYFIAARIGPDPPLTGEAELALKIERTVGKIIRAVQKVPEGSAKPVA